MSSYIYVVFDLDGTLVDTQKHHAQIESNFLSQHGIDILPESITQSYAGRTPREWVAEIFAQHAIECTLQTLESFEVTKNARVVELAEQGVIGLMPGVENFLKQLQTEPTIKMWISSGTSVISLQKLIALFNIPIDIYTSADEVEYKKPAPDVFEKTFEKMGATQADVRIVIGDGVSDIVGGKAAHALTVFVNENTDKGVVAGADMSVKSFDDLTLESIYQLLN